LVGIFINICLLAFAAIPSLISHSLLSNTSEFNGFFPFDGLSPFDVFHKSRLPSETTQTIWRYAGVFTYIALFALGVVRRAFAIALLGLTTTAAGLLVVRIFYGLSQIK